jgi:hypothetical protein
LPQGLEPVELLDGAAVVAVLGAGDFDIPIAGELCVHEDHGVTGVVEGDEVASEMGDFIEVFEADDGESGGREAVFARILCGAGLTLGGAGPGGLGGVGAIGGELFLGDGFSGTWHAFDLPFGDIARGTG